MRGANECRWVTLEEAMRQWFVTWPHGSSSVAHLFDSLAIPTRNLSEMGEGGTYYRGLDIVLAFGIEGVCPTCLRPFLISAKGHVYCTDRCRRTAMRELEKDGAVLAIGVPMIVTSVPGALLSSVRRHAVSNGLSMQQSMRATLFAGAAALQT